MFSPYRRRRARVLLSAAGNLAPLADRSMTLIKPPPEKQKAARAAFPGFCRFGQVDRNRLNDSPPAQSQLPPQVE